MTAPGTSGRWEAEKLPDPRAGAARQGQEFWWVCLVEAGATAGMQPLPELPPEEVRGAGHQLSFHAPISHQHLPRRGWLVLLPATHAHIHTHSHTYTLTGTLSHTHSYTHTFTHYHTHIKTHRHTITHILI